MKVGNASMKKRIHMDKERKADYCARLQALLPSLRNRLGMTQSELGLVSGVSRVTISQLESGRATMNWLHFVALMLVCCENREAKEVIYANGLLDRELLCFLQNTEGETEVNVSVNVEALCDV